MEFSIILVFMTLNVFELRARERQRDRRTDGRIVALLNVPNWWRKHNKLKQVLVALYNVRLEIDGLTEWSLVQTCTMLGLYSLDHTNDSKLQLDVCYLS